MLGPEVLAAYPRRLSTREDNPYTARSAISGSRRRRASTRSRRGQCSVGHQRHAQPGTPNNPSFQARAQGGELVRRRTSSAGSSGSCSRSSPTRLRSRRRRATSSRTSARSASRPSSRGTCTCGRRSRARAAHGRNFPRLAGFYRFWVSGYGETRGIPRSSQELGGARRPARRRCAETHGKHLIWMLACGGLGCFRRGRRLGQRLHRRRLLEAEES